MIVRVRYEPTKNLTHSSNLKLSYSQIYIDQPTNIAQCNDKSTFYGQIDANYDIVYESMGGPSENSCNYTVYRNIANEIKKVTYEMVDTYFNCVKRDCEPEVWLAYSKYVNVTNRIYVPYLACSYIYLDVVCAANINHAVYFSADNILSTLIECARFKASCQQPDYKLLTRKLQTTSDCNCVEMVTLIQSFCQSYDPKLSL